MFNTLKYSKSLEAVGVSREQAEAHIQIMAEIVEDEMATKQDLKETQSTLKNDILELRNKMDAKFEQMEYRLIIKLTAVLVPIISLTIAVTTFIMKRL